MKILQIKINVKCKKKTKIIKKKEKDPKAKISEMKKNRRITKRIKFKRKKENIKNKT